MFQRSTRALLVSLLSLALLGVAAGPAMADNASLLGLGLKAIVKGKEKPAITVSPRADIKKLVVKLTRADGHTQTLKAGKIKVGKQKVLAFKQPQGVYQYSAEFDVSWADGEKTVFTTTFSATKVGELKLQIGAGDVDMDERRMVFRITNPAKSAELVVLGERGRRLGVFEAEYDGTPQGQDLELTWDAVDGDIVRMDLMVTDVAGFWAGMQITPFSIEIPHEEVVFETGKHAIRDSEAPKLERTMGHIQEALAKHGTLLQLRLFVAGYTDTVGSASSNVGLSNRRARAIAQWFKKRGIKVPIHYAGFGEGVLAKPTPDETDEPANRRALYVLSSQSPTGPSFPTASWQKL